MYPAVNCYARRTRTAEAGEVQVKVYRIQDEATPDPDASYDWGPCVMRDGDIYRMWWTRPSAKTTETRPYETTDEKGAPVRFDYPIRGDRIFYAESRDGYGWNLVGQGDEVSLDDYGPDSPHPVIVLTPSETDSERRHLGCPSVVKVKGTFYLYYEAPCAFQVAIDPQGRPEPRAGISEPGLSGHIQRRTALHEVAVQRGAQAYRVGPARQPETGQAALWIGAAHRVLQGWPVHHALCGLLHLVARCHGAHRV